MSTPHLLDLRSIARALGGEISGRQILAPGPGHSRGDRSLSVRIEPEAPDGFLVHSFAGDDPIICKNYIRRQLGLPEWEPGDEQDRRIDASQRARFDRTAIDREAVIVLCGPWPSYPRPPAHSFSAWITSARPSRPAHAGLPPRKAPRTWFKVAQTSSVIGLRVRDGVTLVWLASRDAAE